jgi:hypothetical protein
VGHDVSNADPYVGIEERSVYPKRSAVRELSNDLQLVVLIERVVGKLVFLNSVFAVFLLISAFVISRWVSRATIT